MLYNQNLMPSLLINSPYRKIVFFRIPSFVAKVDNSHFLIQMAKRKIDCSLNDYIIDHLKEGRFEKTLKLFEEKNGGSKKANSEICERFKNYLMANEIKKENEINDLGFEINFGAYEPETKVSLEHDLCFFFCVK